MRLSLIFSHVRSLPSKTSRVVFARVIAGLVFAGLVVVGLVGCSSTPKDDTGWFRDRDYDYRFATQSKRTAIPQGLDENKILDYYPVPPLKVKDTPFVDGLVMPPPPVAADKNKVTLQTLGARQWLLVSASPSQLWPLLKAWLINDKKMLTGAKSREGLLTAKDASGTYVFHVDQGFQRNTAELRLDYRPVNAGESTQEVERDYLTNMGKYLSDALDKPSYSFAAREISTEPSMTLQRSVSGANELILYVDNERAVAAVKKALEKAQFTLESSVRKGEVTEIPATYFPRLLEKPGFFARLFGADPEGLDKSIPHAGNHYAIVITPLANKKQQVKVMSADGGAVASNENRDMTLLLKRYLS